MKGKYVVKKNRKMGFNKRRKVLTNAPGFIQNPPGMQLQTFDQTGTATVSSSGTPLVLLHFPDRTGSNYNNRYGDSTTIKSLRFKYTVKPGVSQLTSTGPQYIRVLIFWDEQPNNAFPSGALPLLALDPNSQAEPQFAYRFKLLRDCRHLVQAQSIGDAVPNIQDIYIKKLSLVSNFNGNSGSISDICTGALLVYFIGDTALTSGNVPVVTYSSRTRFTA